MPHAYRLLRDNKQTVPFSLEELLRLSLEPYDLVWVENKSVGWRYPSEIESLKDYLQDISAETETEKKQTPIQQTHPASQTTRAFVNEAPAEPSESIQDDSMIEEEITAEKLE